MTEKNRIEYVPAVSRLRIEWPNGARIAFYVGINIEYFAIDEHNSQQPDEHLPAMTTHVLREYGARVGVFRIMDLLERHGMRASVLLNSAVCEHYPQIIEEGKKRNWEWLGHGITNNRSLPSYAAEEERVIIHEVKTTITAATGSAPKGWLGPGLRETFDTPDHLVAEGFEYVSDWGCDDQPLPMKVAGGRLLAMPYQQGLNDIALLSEDKYTGEQYANAICDTFDVLYAEAANGGKVLAVPIHPFATGRAKNAKHFERAIEYVTSHADVWRTTSGEISDWYYQRYYK
jgi:peptidoglycan/xylan/chitin deacetylase (PgdA/CDA1 family)